jgi:hypothetical protein
MALKIVENLERVRKLIEDGDKSGSALAELGKEAMFKGIGSNEWETLMKEFVPEGSKELDRLCGRDHWFMSQDPWGPLCIAYIAGDSNCTSATARRGGTMRTMAEVPGRNLLAFIDQESLQE